jgi:hypothetical protein
MEKRFIRIFGKLIRILFLVDYVFLFMDIKDFQFEIYTSIFGNLGNTYIKLLKH